MNLRFLGAALLGQHHAFELAECAIDKCFLLFLVQVRIAHRWRSRSGATGIAEFLAIEHVFMDVMLHKKPRALVLRFVLGPNDFGGVRVFFHLVGKSLVRKRLELLNTHNGNIV